MNRGSFHTILFRRIHPLFLDTDYLQMALRAQNIYGLLRKGPVHYEMTPKQDRSKTGSTITVESDQSFAHAVLHVKIVWYPVDAELFKT